MTSVTQSHLSESALQTRPLLTALAMFALFLAAMDSTAVSTLLPYIKGQFQDQTLYPWLLSGFILASVLVTPVAGVLSDRLGEKRTMQTALGLFLIGSIAIGYAPSISTLIAARVLQGIGAGAIMVTTYVIIGKLYSNQERGKMQGLLSLVWGVAAIVGPMLGALIQEYWGWQMVFLLNVPLCAVIIVMIALLYPNKPVASQGAKIDALTLISFAGLLGGILLLIMAHSLQLGPLVSHILAVIVLVSLIIQVVRIRGNQSRSLVPVAFLRERRFVIPALLTALASIALYATVTLLPLYLSGSKHLSAIEGGFLVMASALGWVVGSAVCGGLISKTNFRITAIIGAVLLVIGVGVLHLLDSTASNAYFAFAQVCIGLGIGFCATTTLVLVQNQSPLASIGGFTSAVQLCRNLGAVVGINVVTALQIMSLRHLETSHSANAWSLSFANSFTVLLYLTIAALVLALLMPKQAQQ
ncbi:MFS transporter [Aquirhabdus parva]|uniref:MFS transporter n=1 Tax=Aquirhabdus parva TaxID=2283318 RepID=A0A345P938_9GAMM|nr:MFS transporter [Aquirhabdus parva]AXI03797.1 MFS transporter [Aquirhabdus parva]